MLAHLQNFYFIPLQLNLSVFHVLLLYAFYSYLLALLLVFRVLHYAKLTACNLLANQVEVVEISMPRGRFKNFKPLSLYSLVIKEDYSCLGSS